jgi:hypothetical protein
VKAIVSLEEAKKKLLELYQAKNPDIDEIVIEGMEPVKATVAISAKQQDSLGVPIVEPPPPDVEEMMKLAASLQNVVDEGNAYSVKYLKGKNRGIVWTVSKGLAIQCTYCPYIAMDDNDLQSHIKTYHKEYYKTEKEKDKQQLEIAKQRASEKVESELGTQRWGSKRVKP